MFVGSGLGLGWTHHVRGAGTQATTGHGTQESRQDGPATPLLLVAGQGADQPATEGAEASPAQPAHEQVLVRGW